MTTDAYDRTGFNLQDGLENRATLMRWRTHQTFGATTLVSNLAADFGK